MGSDDRTHAGEIDLEVAGQKVRTKGYRLVDLIWLPMVLGISYTCLTIFQHEASAQQDKAHVAATLAKSNNDIAGALKENSATLAAALKENNANTLQAIRELTIEQRKATDAVREIACLSDPNLKNASNAREFCKRITRDSR